MTVPKDPSEATTPYYLTDGYEWIAEENASPKLKATSSFPAGSTFGDILDTIYHFRGSTADFDARVFMAINIRETEIVEELSYQVTFNNGGGSGTAQTFTYTDRNALATSTGLAAGNKPEANFTRPGYDFKGWALTNGATTQLIGSAGALKDALTIENDGKYTLYAVWAVQQRTVTFAQNFTGTAGSMPNPLINNVNYGSNFTIPNVTPTRTNYSFAGWATSATGTKAYDPGATINNITADVTLYALWTAYPVVTYDLNSGSGGPSPLTYNVAPNTNHSIVSGVPTRSGYTFAGWTTTQNSAAGTIYSNNGSIAGTQGLLAVGTSNITLYALWNPSVSFNANKPSGALAASTVSNMPANGSATAGQAYTLPNNTPTLQGYTFAGWKANNTGNNIAAGASAGVLSAATTFYAQWTENSNYSVVFYAAATGTSDGTAHNTQSGKKWTDSITVPATPTKTGYNFGGWFLSKDANGNGTGTVVMASATAFKDLWVAAGSNAATTQIKLYAKWTEKDRVTVTLKLNGTGATYNGSTSDYTSESMLQGSNFSIPNYTNPSRTGYNFKGWTESNAGTGTVYQANQQVYTGLTESKILYAKWEAAVVTFSFQPGATTGVTNVKGTSPWTTTANYGSNLSVPAGTTVYTRTGYNFSSWGYTNSSNASATVAAAGASVAVANFKITWTGSSEAGTLAGTATLTANWGDFTYTVQWNSNGGSTANTTTGNVTPSTSLTTPATNPVRAGYTFTGWNTAANGSGTAVTTGSVVSSTWNLTGVSSGGTLVAYAQWKENIVQIRFFKDAYAEPIWNDNTAYANGTVLYVGAATGDIYADAAGSSKTGKNISANMKPNFTNTNYEFNKSHGSKWTIGSAAGTAVADANVSAAGVLTVPKTNNLYTNADYYLTTSPKWIAYTVEYYLQNVNGSGYTKVTTPAGSGTAPFGYTVSAGTAANTNDNTKTITFARSSITGATYNASAAGSVNSLVMGATAANNVLKLYFDRNVHNVDVAYTGDVPAGMTYTPATQTKRYGETVTLTTPTAPTGYTWGGWTLVSGTGVTAAQVRSGSFTMPDSDLVIEGTWSKVKYNVTFKTNTTNGAALIGTSTYSLEFGDSLPAIPTANPKDSSQYYFMGWKIYENCTTAGSEGTGQEGAVMSPEAILGTGVDVATPWHITSNTVFVAQFGRVVTVNYTAGAASGAFTSVDGTQLGSNTISRYGTRYSGLQLGWTLPIYGGAFDPANDRNAGNPKATPGYKFVGWEWHDELLGQTFRVEGYYTGTSNETRQFHRTGGDAMPTTINQSLTFTAIWAETAQHLHYDVTHSNIAGVQGIPATDVAAKTGENVNVPKAPAYTASANATGYTLLGWTTDYNYNSATSKLYTTTFTMTAGERNTTLYTLGESGYGVTLYPVFKENTVTITYTYATGSSSAMGTLSRTNEGNNFAMVSGTPQGSKPTAATGHKFLGWFTDAAHTQAVPASWVSSDGTLKPQKGTDGVFAAATYYAAFEAETYTITFKVGDHGTWTSPANGTDDKTVSLKYNTNYGTNVPTTKANTGYGFTGWKLEGTNTVYSASNLASLKVTGNATFVAQYEERSGFTVTYEPNGGTPSPASQSVSWTAVLNNVMNNDAKNNMKKQGYNFDGWYVTNGQTTGAWDESKKVTATLTFADALTLAGITVDGDTATLPLYAKWTARQITLHFQPKWPNGSTQTIADKVVTWEDLNLLGANETLSAAGYTFTKWSTSTTASGTTVTNATKVSDIYRAVYGTSDNTHSELTIYGVWDQKTFTVKFQADGRDVKTVPNVTWETMLDYYSYAPADGSKRLLGWKYTPAGGTQQTWLQAAGKLAVSAFDGTPTPADGSVFILTADLEDNTKYVINFNKVNVDANGNVVMSTANKLNSINGYTTPGVAIDITNFNTHNYITEFETQNGAGRLPALKGYELKVIDASKTTATASQVTAGGTVTFEVYWVEKMYTITYDLGRDPQGNNAPSTITKPADKTAGWNSTDILPNDTTGLVWEGHKAPKWQYQNTSGTWVTVPAGAKVSDIAKTDDNTQPIVLRALWETDKVRITYAAQTGGTAKNASGSFTVASGSQKYEDIDALTGTAQTLTATASAGYKFAGWYKDGVLLTTDATMTPAKENGMFSSATYEARFTPLGAISYTIEHHFEGLDGVFVQNAALNDVRTGEEFSTINVSNDMIKNIKGFTYKAGLTGSKETIASLVDGEVLKLFYQRNAYDVWVTAAQGDAPATVPTVNYPATGINQAHTTQKFGTDLVLPSITAPAGWAFAWTVSYKDSDATTTTTTTMANGAPFTMPDAAVNIIGTWTRLAHTVNFIAGTGAHGTVTATDGKTLPFSVDHGKTLMDASATGNSNNVKVTADNEWAFAGWKYTDAAGVERTTMNPDSIVIDADTVFTAIWAQTFFVAYNPGAHGGNGFTTQITAGDDISGQPSVATFPLMIGGTDRTTNAPAADGYRFVGWSWNLGGNDFYWLAVSDYSAAGLAGTAATMDFNVTNNVIFNAIWEALPQDLIYKLDITQPASEWTATGRPGLAGAGNEYHADPKPRTDETVTLLTSADVQREGYEFAGWAIWNDANGDGVITSNELSGRYTGTFKMPAHGVTFVPVWNFASISVKFEFADGAAGRGTLSSTVENIVDGTKVRLDGSIATPKPGYAFDGWYMDAAHTTKVPNSWLDYDFDADGNVIGVALKPMRPADGWIPAIYYANFIPAAAQYTIDFYFQQADGSYAKLESGKYHDIMSEALADVMDPTNPASTHLIDTTAGKWLGYGLNDNHFAQILSAIVAGDGSTVLKVYYDRIPFNIEYELGGGNWTLNPGPDTAIAESNVTIPGAQLTGQKLTGWVITWTDANTGEAKSTTIGAGAAFQMPYADVLATAVWAQYVDVLIEFVTDNGVQTKFDELLVPNAGLVGDVYTAPLDIVNKYRPAGYKNPATLPSIVLETAPDGRNIVTVIYQLANDYIINFDANTGKYADNKTVLKVEGLSMADRVTAAGNPLPTKFGYTLGKTPNRWNTKADGTGTWLTATMTYEELVKAIFGSNYNDETLRTTGMTVYAMWSELDNLEVKFDLNNDKNTNPGVIKPVPDWQTPQIIEDMTGVKWTQSGFNLKDANGFDGAPHGYEFVGWNTKRDGSGLTITDATKYFDMSNAIDPNHEQSSITLYAMWKEIIVKIEYTVTEGGTIDRVVDYVSAVTGQHVGEGSSAGNRLHSIATGKPGYTFKGWELVSENGVSRLVNTTNDWKTLGDLNEHMFVVEPDEDGRLYSAVYRAVFTKNADAVIEYDPNGGNGSIPATRAPHSTTGTISNGSGINRGHHTLVGWNTAADGSGTSYKLGQNITFPEGGMKLFAQWQINSYPVTVKDRDDKIADVIGGSTNTEWGKGIPGQFISTVAQAPKNGATFKGWSYTMIDSDTGETITGVINDLSELVILGPTEIEALYDYEEPLAPEAEIPAEDVVEGGSTLPKTADDTNVFVLALIALIALFVIVIAARKRNDREAATETDRNWFEAREGEAELNTNGRKAEWAAIAHNIIRKMRNTMENNVSRSAGTDIVRSPGSFFMPGDGFKSVPDTSGTGSNLSRTLRGQASFTFIASTATALVLAVVVAFMPGIAVASTGDPGSSDANTATQSNTQTQHSNDPATSKTGSSASNGARSSAASSSSASSASSADEAERQAHLNKLAAANRNATGSSYSVSPSSIKTNSAGVAVTRVPSASNTYSNASSSVSGVSGAAPSTSAAYTARGTSSATTYAAPTTSRLGSSAATTASSSAAKKAAAKSGSLNRVAAASASAQNAPLTSASAGISDPAREDAEALTLVTGVAPASQSGTAAAQDDALAAGEGSFTYVCEVPLVVRSAGSEKNTAPASNDAFVDDGLQVSAVRGREDEAIIPATLANEDFLSTSSSNQAKSSGSISHFGDTLLGDGFKSVPDTLGTGSELSRTLWGQASVTNDAVAEDSELNAGLDVASNGAVTDDANGAINDAALDQDASTALDSAPTAETLETTAAPQVEADSEVFNTEEAENNEPALAEDSEDPETDQTDASTPDEGDDNTSEGSDNGDADGDSDGNDGTNNGNGEGEDEGAGNDNNGDGDGDTDGNNGNGEGEGGGDKGDTTDTTDPIDPDPTDPTDPVDPDPVKPTDPVDPAPADTPSIRYLSTDGGTITRTSDPLNDLQGVTAKADRGYCFKAWLVSIGTDPDTAKIFSNNATLTANQIRDYALEAGEDASALVFTAIFKANTYTFKYDLQGAQAEDASAFTSTSATFGEGTAATSGDTLKKDGYKFLCWNTSPDGQGVAIHNTDALVDDKLHTMFLIDALKDTSGAETTLYARWVPTSAPAADGEVSEASMTQAAVDAFRDKAHAQMKDPAIAAIFANSSSAPTSLGSASSTSTRPAAASSTTSARPASFTPTAFAPFAAAAAPVIEAIPDALPSVEDALAALQENPAIELLSNLAEAVVLPPALEVLPATTEGITTVSAEALTGLSEGEMAPAQAAEAVGTTVAAVAAVAVAAGAAGAAATAVANAKTSNAMNRKRRWKFMR
ncbi:InlB B-repeat-containing protein [Anaerotardibacter muris]|uniref:InlB B-repeat-containing protein n=1 Tax=Anaerotardibacter muris TaxID=2941505 RepID=UPI00203C1828|nr:InlB B-repeat-containing protein [Anaerotardibacter muris]